MRNPKEKKKYIVEIILVLINVSLTNMQKLHP